MNDAAEKEKENLQRVVQCVKNLTEKKREKENDVYMCVCDREREWIKKKDGRKPELLPLFFACHYFFLIPILVAEHGASVGVGSALMEALLPFSRSLFCRPIGLGLGRPTKEE